MKKLIQINKKSTVITWEYPEDHDNPQEFTESNGTQHKLTSESFNMLLNGFMITTAFNQYSRLST